MATILKLVPRPTLRRRNAFRSDPRLGVSRFNPVRWNPVIDRRVISLSRAPRRADTQRLQKMEFYRIETETLIRSLSDEFHLFGFFINELVVISIATNPDTSSRNPRENVGLSSE